MIQNLFFLLVFTVGLSESLKGQRVHSRTKRFGVFNKGGATRVRVIMGFGIPLALEEEAITLGIVIAAQYQLPSNISDYKPSYFPGLIEGYVPSNLLVNHPFGRFKREVKTDKLTGQTYESYDAKVEEVGNEALKNVSEKNHNDSYFDDEFTDDGKTLKFENFPTPTEEELTDHSGSRWLLYDGLGKLLNSKGMVGRPCVLRAICEAANSQFTHHAGLFGELLHIFFS